MTGGLQDLRVMRQIIIAGIWIMNYGYRFLIFLVTWMERFVLEGPGPTFVLPPASCEAWSFSNTRGGLRVSGRTSKMCVLCLPESHLRATVIWQIKSSLCACLGSVVSLFLNGVGKVLASSGMFASSRCFQRILNDSQWGEAEVLCFTSSAIASTLLHGASHVHTDPCSRAVSVWVQRQQLVRVSLWSL